MNADEYFNTADWNSEYQLCEEPTANQSSRYSLEMISTAYRMASSSSTGLAGESVPKVP
jgi:hypothetical protein